jgi:hypothetical protein
MTMIKRTLFAAMILVFVAACSKPAPAPKAADHDDDEEAATSAPAAVPQPEKPKDYAKQAQGVMMLLSTAPECQQWRDELQAIIDAPAGTKPVRDPIQVVAAAHDARCSKKARGE